MGEGSVRADKPTALGDGWRPRSLRCPAGPSLGRHSSASRFSAVALSVADPPSGQRKVGLLVVAYHLEMAGTTENPWPARRAPIGRGPCIPIAEGTRPVSVQAHSGVMEGFSLG